jgi:hypothetical protein
MRQNRRSARTRLMPALASALCSARLYTILYWLSISSSISSGVLPNFSSAAAAAAASNTTQSACRQCSPDAHPVAPPPDGQCPCALQVNPSSWSMHMPGEGCPPRHERASQTSAIGPHYYSRQEVHTWDDGLGAVGAHHGEIDPAVLLLWCAHTGTAASSVASIIPHAADAEALGGSCRAAHSRSMV